jgi:Predicted transcriptional regulator with C-terminal CBS domains
MQTKFRERRKQLGLKLKVVAKMAGISEEYLSQIETGARGKKMNYPLLVRIAKALETTPEALMSIEPEQTESVTDHGEETQPCDSRGRD